MSDESNNNHSGVSIHVRGLRKSFDSQEVLKGIDFEVKPGETEGAVVTCFLPASS